MLSNVTRGDFVAIKFAFSVFVGSATGVDNRCGGGDGYVLFDANSVFFVITNAWVWVDSGFDPFLNYDPFLGLLHRVNSFGLSSDFTTHADI